MEQDSSHKPRVGQGILAADTLGPGRVPRLKGNGMLVLSRKVGERLHIGPDVVVVISGIHGNRVHVGIEAPDAVRIIRGEFKPTAAELMKPSQNQADKKAG